MTAVYYEGSGRFTLGEGEPVLPGPGEVRLDVAFCGVCGTDLHIAHGHMDHRVRVPQVIGHEMSGTIAELGPDVHGFAVGESVVVRPLDTRGETPADKGVSHICRELKFLGIDTPGRLPELVDGARLHAPPAPREPSTSDGGARRAARGRVPRCSPRRARRRRVGRRDRRRADRVARRARREGAGSVSDRERGEPVPPRSSQPSSASTSSTPTATDLPAAIFARTDGAGADVVFEVSRLCGGRRRDDAARVHPRPDRRRRDLPGAAARAAVRLLLEGAAAWSALASTSRRTTKRAIALLAAGSAARSTV